ncbi:unnamed protein product [Blepharisma stoltei]|uniref:Uncharacterized protein n=1 Tax=Blepharisma stoltei TaxID=1481888 RepID=A0AAU9J885_9CILI|nr:unnamed protein product [Blepharisma stoltei]
MADTSELHFYIMWFALIVAISCFFSLSICGVLNGKPVKVGVFLLILFAGSNWVNDVTTMRNTPNFNEPGIEPEKLLELKHNYSKLQRDVYMEFIEMISLFLILLLPYWHESYLERIRYLEKRVKEEEENCARLISSKN